MTSLVPGHSPAPRRVRFVLAPLGRRLRWVGGLANPLSASGPDVPNLVIGIILLGVVISVRVGLLLNLVNSYFLGLVGRSTAILGLLKFSSGLLRFSNVFGTCCIMLNLLDGLPFAWLLVGLPPVGLLLRNGEVSRVWSVLPSGGVGSVLPLSLGLSPLVGFACHRVFALAR